MSAWRGWRPAFAVAAVVLAGGCSDDPSGPGWVDLVVSAPVPLGAAVVQISGSGVEEFEQPAQGWFELVPMPPSGTTPVHRVVVIQEQPGELRLRVRVADLDAPLPSASVMEATDASDAPLASLASVEASLRR